MIDRDWIRPFSDRDRANQRPWETVSPSCAILVSDRMSAFLSRTVPGVLSFHPIFRNATEIRFERRLSVTNAETSVRFQKHCETCGQTGSRTRGAEGFRFAEEEDLRDDWLYASDIELGRHEDLHPIVFVGVALARRMRAQFPHFPFSKPLFIANAALRGDIKDLKT